MNFVINKVPTKVGNYFYIVAIIRFMTIFLLNSNNNIEANDLSQKILTNREAEKF